MQYWSELCGRRLQLHGKNGSFTSKNPYGLFIADILEVIHSSLDFKGPFGPPAAQAVEMSIRPICVRRCVMCAPVVAHRVRAGKKTYSG